MFKIMFVVTRENKPMLLWVKNGRICKKQQNIQNPHSCVNCESFDVLRMQIYNSHDYKFSRNVKDIYPPDSPMWEIDTFYKDWQLQINYL